MYSLIVNHNQIKKLKRIVASHLDNEKINTIKLNVLASTFTKWKLDFINNRSNEFGAQAILSIAKSKYNIRSRSQDEFEEDKKLLVHIYNQNNIEEIKQSAAKLF